MQPKGMINYVKLFSCLLCSVVAALLICAAVPGTALAAGDVERYQVRSGDTLYALAKESGASIDLLAAMNDIEPDAVLTVGQTLLLPHDPTVAVVVQKGDTLWSIAKRYDTSVDFLMNYNKITNADKLAVGQTIAVPRPNLAEEPQSVSVMAAASNKANFTVSMRQVTLASRQSANVQTGKVSWVSPLSGIISSDYGKRKSGFHHGVDIAADKGSNIVAAASGKVTFAGYKNSIYGNTVIIEHPDGYTTLYAHMSKVLVDAGDTVKAGKTIGKVGATGNATGPHLHFQISKNGTVVNPNKYVSLK